MTMEKMQRKKKKLGNEQCKNGKVSLLPHQSTVSIIYTKCDGEMTFLRYPYLLPQKNEKIWNVNYIWFKWEHYKLL